MADEISDTQIHALELIRDGGLHRSGPYNLRKPTAFSMHCIHEMELPTSHTMLLLTDDALYLGISFYPHPMLGLILAPNTNVRSLYRLYSDPLRRWTDKAHVPHALQVFERWWQPFWENWDEEPKTAAKKAAK